MFWPHHCAFHICKFIHWLLVSYVLPSQTLLEPVLTCSMVFHFNSFLLVFFSFSFLAVCSRLGCFLSAGECTFKQLHCIVPYRMPSLCAHVQSEMPVDTSLLLDFHTCHLLFEYMRNDLLQNCNHRLHIPGNIAFLWTADTQTDRQTDRQLALSLLGHAVSYADMHNSFHVGEISDLSLLKVLNWGREKLTLIITIPNNYFKMKCVCTNINCNAKPIGPHLFLVKIVYLMLSSSFLLNLLYCQTQLLTIMNDATAAMWKSYQSDCAGCSRTE